MSVNIDKLRKIYKITYQTPTMRRVIDINTHEVKSAILSDLTCKLLDINKAKHYNVYVEKYYDPTRIRTIILDFDGNKSKEDVKEVSDLLEDKDIMHLIVDSTNKGYHIYIILPKLINFQLNRNRRFNNKIFTNFIINLIGDYDTLDKANYGLYSNIRQIGSVHPKTGKTVRVKYAYAPYITNDLKIESQYYNNDTEVYKAFTNSLSFLKYKNKIDNAIKNRSKNRYYMSNVVDLRTLFNGKSYDGGKSKWCHCRWHNDDKPSLRVYEKVAYCKVCGLIPFSEIKREFGL